MAHYAAVAKTAFKACVIFSVLSLFTTSTSLHHSTSQAFFGARRFNSTMATLPIKLNDGTTIPWLGFGSGTALFSKDASQQVTQAIQAGFRHIDAAQVYGNEESVGEGIAASGVPRSELYITTKLFKVPEGKTVRDTLVESLRKLRTDHVDLFLIHMPNNHPDLQQTWKDLEALKAEGLTKSIGVSNFQAKHLNSVLEVATVVPAANQVRVSTSHAHAFSRYRTSSWCIVDMHRSSSTRMSSRQASLSSSCTRRRAFSPPRSAGSRPSRVSKADPLTPCSRRSRSV